MYNLGTLPGGSFSIAQAVSGNHRIVGMSGTSSGGEHGFFYADHMLDIGTLRGGTWSAAFGINDSNIIVGDGDDAGGRTRALLWDTSFNVFDLATLPGGSNSRALAINNGG
jgi:probable HAF family extracellular repeat protein